MRIGLIPRPGCDRALPLSYPRSVEPILGPGRPARYAPSSTVAAERIGPGMSFAGTPIGAGISTGRRIEKQWGEWNNACSIPAVHHKEVL